MSLWNEAKSYLEWEQSKALVRLPLPILEVILEESLGSEERALVEKVLQSLPFEVAGFERVSKARTAFCIDFTGKHPEVLASVAVGDLLKDPEQKKLLWQKLLSKASS